VVLGIIGAVTGGSKSSDAAASPAPGAARPQVADVPDASVATDPPTPKPLSRQEQKRRFLVSVDESISGERIAGNPYKFVGRHVDLHCVINSIPQAEFLNATCPPDEYGNGPNIVVQMDTRSLENHQPLRVIGTVVDPMEGNNAMGGDMHFPTVKAEFAE
jgi:hypothetical protein